MEFSKYHGTGNDFIFIDQREGSFPLSKEQIVKLCHRNYGVGADGLIALCPSQKGDFAMRIFNSDGTEAEMCGNGLRCLIQFIKDLGIEGDAFQIETMKKVYPCSIKNNKIAVAMGLPKIVEKKPSGMFLEVGVPHFVTFVEDLALFDLEAPKHFSVLGVNINYAKLEASNAICMRTFERGVEKETFSCGSGATAVCMAAYEQFGIRNSLKVIFASGEALDFELDVENETLQNITMSGTASYVFKGKIDL